MEVEMMEATSIVTKRCKGPSVCRLRGADELCRRSIFGCALSLSAVGLADNNDEVDKTLNSMKVMRWIAV